MSSSIMHKPLAIHLNNVSKVYKLHGSQADQLIDVLGLQKIGFKTRSPTKEFSALSNISLDVPRGHRIGIVGRNGAGKTTLLKLICGNFAPTSGEVVVNGTVQALMSVGLGFHPEYTGRENVEASLQYNGLTKGEYLQALEGVIEFCELGDFLDQPFKTYSLGMQARLMFAAATAIKPDILIVDEVLGAGDAYFVAKSKIRVQKMIDSGCTMLLVSHSMQQVLELCDEAIWLDGGKIRMRGESLGVVKAYEEYLHGASKRISSLEMPGIAFDSNLEGKVSAVLSEDAHEDMEFKEVIRPSTLPAEVLLQEPYLVPHSMSPTFPVEYVDGFHFEAPGGISRWESEEGLKVVGFSIICENGLTNQALAMRPVKFVITIIAEKAGEYSCRYGVALNNHLGACVTRVFSPQDSFELKFGEKRVVEVLLNPCQIGPGEYTVGISVLEHTPLEFINHARRYDLLSRSFILKIDFPESLLAIQSDFFHTAEWGFKSKCA